MTRVELQIARARRKLMAGRFVDALAWGALAVAAASLVALIVERLAGYALPGAEWVWLLCAAVFAVIAAGAWAVICRPTPLEAAREMDRALQTHDRFATAVCFRGSSDEFAAAARGDAEEMAGRISLRRQFRPQFSRAGRVATAVAAAAVLAWLLLPSMDLLGRQRQIQTQVARQEQTQSAKEAVKEALARVRSVPPESADAQTLKKAENDLEALLHQDQPNPAAVHRKALEALQSVDESMRQKIEEGARFAQLQEQRDLMRSLTPASDEKPSELTGARRAMREGNFAQAQKELEKATGQFRTGTEEQKKEMSRRMGEMARQLGQAADDSTREQEAKRQLEQMGATPPEAQRMAGLLPEAARGEEPARKELRQMADKIAGKSGGESAESRQRMKRQLEQSLQKMQGKEAASQRAGQLAKAADQMARAMEGNDGRQLATAEESMRQQLSKMGALRDDIQGMQAMQESMRRAADQQQAALNGQLAARPEPSAAEGSPRAGSGHVVAPPADDSVKPVYKTVVEQAPMDAGSKAPPLAGSFISAPALKGESHIEISRLKEVAEREAAQSAELQHIPPPVRQSVKEYFDFSDSGK